MRMEPSQVEKIRNMSLEEIRSLSSARDGNLSDCPYLKRGKFSWKWGNRELICTAENVEKKIPMEEFERERFCVRPLGWGNCPTLVARHSVKG